MDQYSYEDDKSSSSYSDTHGLLNEESVTSERQRKSRKRWPLIVLGLNCTALLVHTILLVLVYSNQKCRCNASEVLLPSHEYTKDAIQMELRDFDDVFHDHPSLYRGNPREELDEAWQHLMKGFSMRVPSPGWATPTRQNRSMVHLNDGSGDMMAVPAVLHEIHCLRTIREYLFPEQYPVTARRYPVVPPNMMNVHIDHCIDGLRQAAMCHADMTLMTYEWWDEHPYPQVVPGSAHVCANWDKLSQWVQDHSFSHFTPGILTHPTTGHDPWSVADGH